jgi:hypothetical protein
MMPPSDNFRQQHGRHIESLHLARDGGWSAMQSISGADH